MGMFACVREMYMRMYSTYHSCRATEYKLLYRQFTEPWEQAKELVFDADTTSTIVSGLLPTNTYQFQLTVLKGEQESEPSEIVSGDTLAADCSGSGGKKKKCRIQ